MFVLILTVFSLLVLRKGKDANPNVISQDSDFKKDINLEVPWKPGYVVVNEKGEKIGIIAFVEDGIPFKLSADVKRSVSLPKDVSNIPTKEQFEKINENIADIREGFKTHFGLRLIGTFWTASTLSYEFREKTVVGPVVYILGEGVYSQVDPSGTANLLQFL